MNSETTGGSGVARTAEDAPALDDIAEMLRDPDWGVGMLEDIAAIVSQTGRPTDSYPDESATWSRH